MSLHDEVSNFIHPEMILGMVIILFASVLSLYYMVSAYPKQSRILHDYLHKLNRSTSRNQQFLLYHML